MSAKTVFISHRRDAIGKRFARLVKDALTRRGYDVFLDRARLFFREKEYPWQSPQNDLAEARKLIEKCGCGRRKEELEDAEEAVKAWADATSGIRETK